MGCKPNSLIGRWGVGGRRIKKDFSQIRLRFSWIERKIERKKKKRVTRQGSQDPKGIIKKEEASLLWQFIGLDPAKAGRGVSLQQQRLRALAPSGGFSHLHW